MFALMVLTVAGIISAAGGLCLLAEQKLVLHAKNVRETTSRYWPIEQRLRYRYPPKEQLMLVVAELCHLLAMVLMFLVAVVILLLAWIGYQSFMMWAFPPPP